MFAASTRLASVAAIAALLIFAAGSAHAQKKYDPGATDTEMLRAANPGATFEDTVARTALRRLGQPGDIAAVVAFLAGPDSGWISGQNLAADGGLLP